jgi:hypothetical protein
VGVLETLNSKLHADSALKFTLLCEVAEAVGGPPAPAFRCACLRCACAPPLSGTALALDRSCLNDTGGSPLSIIALLLIAGSAAAASPPLLARVLGSPRVWEALLKSERGLRAVRAVAHARAVV